jgi:hypothetical protein
MMSNHFFWKTLLSMPDLSHGCSMQALDLILVYFTHSTYIGAKEKA